MIRKFESRDLEGVMELWLETNISAHSFIPSNYWRENYKAVKEMLPKATIYVHQEKEQLDGFAGLVDSYIAGIFVREDQQSHGIGKKLLNRVKQTHDALLLDVFVDNTRAVQFYLRQGFVVRKEHLDEKTQKKEYRMEWQRTKE